MVEVKSKKPVGVGCKSRDACKQAKPVKYHKSNTGLTPKRPKVHFLRCENKRANCIYSDTEPWKATIKKYKTKRLPLLFEGWNVFLPKPKPCPKTSRPKVCPKDMNKIPTKICQYDNTVCGYSKKGRSWKFSGGEIKPVGGKFFRCAQRLKTGKCPKIFQYET